MDVGILLLLVVGAVVLVLLGIHVAIALGTISLLVIGLMNGFGVALDLLSTTFYRGLQVYEFGVVPLFVLMGVILAQTRLSSEIFESAAHLLRRIPGCLAVATVVGNAGFSAVTGTSLASAAAFSGIAYGPSVKRGYDRRLVLGAVAGSSVLGMLIPPSILLILYGVLTETSIGALFIAGIVPGLLLTLLYGIGIVIAAKVRPSLVGVGAEVAAEGIAVPEPLAALTTEVPPHSLASSGIGISDTTGGLLEEPTTHRDHGETAVESSWRIIVRPWPVAMLAFLVLGGIYGGLFTATEAGAIGALGALVIAAARRELPPRKLIEVLVRTGVTTASLMFVIVAAKLYARVLAMTGFVGEVSRWFQELEASSLVVLGLFIILIIVMGMLLDSTSILLLIVPIAVPILTGLGFEAVWLGVVLVVAIEIGLITPPLGLVAYTIKSSLGDEVTLEEIFAGSFPFVVVMLLFLVLLVLFPPITLWLGG